jgi:hypothetical protein
MTPKHRHEIAKIKDKELLARMYYTWKELAW